MSIKMISKPIIIAATATLAVSALGGYVWYEQQRPKVLEIYVFALKTGRSMFIRTPNDRRILVDGGGNSEIIKHLTNIIPFYSRRIDSIIVTNTEGKNVSGLIDVVNRYSVDKVYIPKFTLENLGIASSTDQIFQTFTETIKLKNIQIEEVYEGNELTLGYGPDLSNPSKVQAKIIFPTPPDLFAYSKASAPEVLMQITYSNNSLLFIGNSSKKVQKFIALASTLGSSVNLPLVSQSDVLIVSHSALSENMSIELLNVIRPDSLIYSKVITNSSLSKSNSSKTIKKTAIKKKLVADPLAMILNEDRFNLKEIGTIKIVSDGNGVTIIGSN